MASTKWSLYLKYQLAKINSFFHQTDYILVFPIPPRPPNRSAKSIAYRDKYLNNIRLSGLDVEEEVVPLLQSSPSGDKFLHFVKIHVPFPVLCTHAEQLSLRAPLQSLPNESDNWSDGLFRVLRISNPMYEFVPNKPLDYYTCPFKRSKMDRFLGNGKPLIFCAFDSLVLGK